MSCHFWQFYEVTISGERLHKAAIFENFMKLPLLATSQSCHIIIGNFTKLLYNIRQVHKVVIIGNFTKLLLLATIITAKLGNS